jgi:hypothetical protein
MLHASFLLGLFFSPEDRSDVFSQNIGLISQMIEVFQKSVCLLERRSVCRVRVQRCMSQMLNILPLELVDLQPEAALGS